MPTLWDFQCSEPCMETWETWAMWATSSCTQVLLFIYKMKQFAKFPFIFPLSLVSFVVVVKFWAKEPAREKVCLASSPRLQSIIVGKSRDRRWDSYSDCTHRQEQGRANLHMHACTESAFCSHGIPCIRNAVPIVIRSSLLSFIKVIPFAPSPSPKTNWMKIIPHWDSHPGDMTWCRADNHN